ALFFFISASWLVLENGGAAANCIRELTATYGFLGTAWGPGDAVRVCRWTVRQGALNRLVLEPVALSLPEGSGSLKIYAGDSSRGSDSRLLSLNGGNSDRGLWALGPQPGPLTVEAVMGPAGGSFNLSYQLAGACIPGFQQACPEDASVCFSPALRCDGLWRCKQSGADELNCRGCAGSYACRYGNRCYTSAERCDGRPDCRDATDELDCAASRCGPANGSFLCDSGRCLPAAYRCDSVVDCQGGEDEAACERWPRPSVALAAVLAATAGCLLLLLAATYACRLRQLRAARLAAAQRLLCSGHESPLARLVAAEMRRRRPPPPNYEQAMRTSVPASDQPLLV
ncbi:hypothetical protein BOX15_Mlig011570g1, partial [Macrostomum lignano]